MDNKLISALTDDTQTHYAKLAGVSQAYISQLVSGVRRPGPTTAIKLAAATNYRITPHQIRPDLYPHPDDGLPDHLRSHRNG
jgi:DNA-binding transcriptional regulator YdaS (Cro superfamily)